MTQEERQLLLKDLCARLPYGVIVDNPNPAGGSWDEVINIDTSAKTVTLLYNGRVFSIDYVKPYLRPMSSMTEEEREEYWKFVEHRKILYDNGSYDGARNILRLDIPNRLSNFTDWLNSHHFDYRGLIEKSLALIAPEGMYES